MNLVPRKNCDHTKEVKARDANTEALCYSHGKLPLATVVLITSGTCWLCVLQSGRQHPTEVSEPTNQCTLCVTGMDVHVFLFFPSEPSSSERLGMVNATQPWRKLWLRYFQETFRGDPLNTLPIVCLAEAADTRKPLSCALRTYSVETQAALWQKRASVL